MPAKWCIVSLACAPPLLFSGLLYLLCQDRLLPVPDVPAVPDIWWGEGEVGGEVEDQEIVEFKVSVPEETITDLRSRIQSDLARLSPPLESSNFENGFNSEFLKEVANYWMEEFDWRSQETLLNSFPQFKTNIDGLEVHFLHLKPKETSGKKIIPLLLAHGWPGTVVEFLDIIPLLASGDDTLAFEVVAPSIPGYGFSSAPTKPGFNVLQAAKIFQKLMLRLGHDQFYCQGGDWGSIITTNLATLFPENVLGLHVNMGAVISPGGTLKNFLIFVPGMKYLLVDREDMEMEKVENPGTNFVQMMRETGYLHLQATKPDTIGVGLSGSPLGLAAYILEKFSTWTKPEWTSLKSGGLMHGHPIEMDRMLANIMLYWVTNSITSSMRFYKENFPVNEDISRIPLQMPVGFADFPDEPYRVPKCMITGKFPNLIQYTRMPRGGHFAAMEVPELLAEDFIKFVRKAEIHLDKVVKQEL